MFKTIVPTMSDLILLKRNTHPKENLTFCIKYEDIIKLLVGEITMDKIKISNL